MQFIDLYQILGISRHADAAEIKRAYRVLARDLHPDTSSLPDAKTRFQILNDAYQILNDPLRRRLYNLQYDRYQAWRKQREEAIAAQQAYQAQQQAAAASQSKTKKRSAKQAHKQTPPPPPPPPPPNPFVDHSPHQQDTRTRARQRTSHAEPYVSMAQVRQKQFFRYIPTVRTIAIFVWIFVGLQMLDRASTTVMDVEKVQASEITGGQWSGVFLNIETNYREFREDIYGYVDLQPGDLLQFEETWMMKRETEFMLIYTATERQEKQMGQQFINRLFYPFYVINLLLLISSFAGFFLPDNRAELRFKFGLACIFFSLLSLAINLVF